MTTRSVRIQSDLNKRLQEEAQEQNRSVNNLITVILQKYFKGANNE